MNQKTGIWWRNRSSLTLVAFLGIGGYFLWTEHQAHVIAFVVIMLGFLFQWPTLLTLVMFPVLVFMYVRLARHEEREALVEFGDTYRAYMREVPAFVPRFAGANASGRPPAGETGGN